MWQEMELRKTWAGFSSPNRTLEEPDISIVLSVTLNSNVQPALGKEDQERFCCRVSLPILFGVRHSQINQPGWLR